jgi:hypothetical protein
MFFVAGCTLSSYHYQLIECHNIAIYVQQPPTRIWWYAIALRSRYHRNLLDAIATCSRYCITGISRETIAPSGIFRDTIATCRRYRRQQPANHCSVRHLPGYHCYLQQESQATSGKPLLHLPDTIATCSWYRRHQPGNHFSVRHLPGYHCYMQQVLQASAWKPLLRLASAGIPYSYVQHLSQASHSMPWQRTSTTTGISWNAIAKFSIRHGHLVACHCYICALATIGICWDVIPASSRAN